MTADLSYRISTVRSDTMPKFFLAIAHSYDSLAVSIPSQVIDPTADNIVFAFCGPSADAVPNTDCTRDITAGDVISRGREPSDGCGSGVRSVLGCK